MSKKVEHASLGKTAWFTNRGADNFVEFSVVYYSLSTGVLLSLDDLLVMWGDSPASKERLENFRGSHTLKFETGFDTGVEIDVISLEYFMRMMDELDCGDEPNEYVERAWSLHEFIIDDFRGA